MASISRYFKIIGVLDNGDTSFTYTIKQVTDFTGTVDVPNPPEQYAGNPGGNELPRGTIVKVTDTKTRTITVNPTS